MTIDEMIKQNSADDGLDREAIEEVAELIGSKLIPEVIRIADKYNYDRDSMVKYCADLYSTMAKVATFENWKGEKEWPNKWTPVSERLPGDGKYLVTRGDVIGRPMTGMRYFSKDLSKVDEYEFESKKGVSGWCEYDSEYGWYIDDKVTAWMPLPEPYKAESENKE